MDNLKFEFDGVVNVIRNFSSTEECKELSDWVMQAVEEGQFVDGIHRNSEGHVVRVKFRLTNRISYKIVYPKVVYDVRNRIENFLGLEGKLPIEGHGVDGVVVSITYEGGDVYEHVDPSVNKGLQGLRCNLIVSAPESGGVVTINDKPYNFNAGDLHCYLVTKYRHKVSTCYGKTPRIIFMFGWCV